MGLSTAFYTVDGEIIGESSNGIRLDYLSDALGSVTAKVNDSGGVVSTSRYGPYGTTLAGAAYSFGWNGIHGYRDSKSGHYVRARHYYNVGGVWGSVDRIWPIEQSYHYAKCNPSMRIDPTGHASVSRHRIPGNGDYTESVPSMCGIYVVNWKFVISPISEATGWLVQRIDDELKAVSCDGSRGFGPGCGVFYEVFIVVNGVDGNPYSVRNIKGQYVHGFEPNSPDNPDDQWGNHRPGACTIGFNNTKASLSFYPDDRVKNAFDPTNPTRDFPWLREMGFKWQEELGHVDCSAKAPSSLTFSGPGPWQEQGPATLESRWQCCRPRTRCSSTNQPLCSKCSTYGPCEDDYFNVTS